MDEKSERLGTRGDGRARARRGGGDASRADRRDSPDAAFLRAENEDDDGYDPYSDRSPEPEPLFERDPWA